MFVIMGFGLLLGIIVTLVMIIFWVRVRRVARLYAVSPWQLVRDRAAAKVPLSCPRREHGARGGAPAGTVLVKVSDLAVTHLASCASSGPRGAPSFRQGTAVAQAAQRGRHP